MLLQTTQEKEWTGSYAQRRNAQWAPCFVTTHSQSNTSSLTRATLISLNDLTSSQLGLTWETKFQHELNKGQQWHRISDFSKLYLYSSIRKI
jgi:hypothetical protein